MIFTIEHEQEPQQSYIDSRTFWERDINGNIALVNTAINSVKTILITPTRVQDDISTESKITEIKEFIKQFGILKDNAWEMIDPKMQKRLDAWFNSMNTQKDIVNINLLKEGFTLSRELQGTLAEQRVKDITPHEHHTFPFGYYTRLKAEHHDRRAAAEQAV